MAATLRVARSHTRRPSGGTRSSARPRPQVKCEAQKLIVWELFTLLVVDASRREVSLQSSHQKFLCAEPSGTLVADRDGRGGWETFRLVSVGGSGVDRSPAVVALQCAHEFRFVTAEKPARLTATSKKVGPAERFTLLDGVVARRVYGDTRPPRPAPAPTNPPQSAALAQQSLLLQQGGGGGGAGAVGGSMPEVAHPHSLSAFALGQRR